MKVNRENLLRVLNTVSPGLTPRELIEQSSTFCFKNGEVFTFNDEIACRMSSGLEKGFTGAVPAKPLKAILEKLVEDEIEITQEEGEVILAGKGRKAGVRMEAEILLPIDMVEKPEKWQDLHENFLEAISLVSQCVSKDESRTDLVCVHFHPKWLEAADSNHIARYKIPIGVSESTLVRGESLKHIGQLGVNEMAETAAWMHFRNPQGLIFSCRRYVEQFPEIGDILKLEGSSATLPPGLAEAADKAAVFSEENVDDNFVRVELRSGKLRIKGQGISGWYSETKKIKYDGPTLAFLISPKLLQQIVKKHSDVIISADRLKVEGGKWCYVACLYQPEAIEKEVEESKKDVEDTGAKLNGARKKAREKVTTSEE